MKITKILLLIFLILGGIEIEKASGATPGEILNKVATKVKSAKGISATFNVSSPGGSVGGAISASGQKFAVKAGGNESWYNGKALYTYNSTSKETTVVTPTASELAEINPLLYLNNYNQYFTPSFSKSNTASRYVIDLKGKSRKAPVKKVTVFINAKSMIPEKFIVTASDGSMTTVTLSNVNYSAALKTGVFEYPKSRFAGVTVVDLR